MGSSVTKRQWISSACLLLVLALGVSLYRLSAGLGGGQAVESLHLSHDGSAGSPSRPSEELAAPPSRHLVPAPESENEESALLPELQELLASFPKQSDVPLPIDPKQVVYPPEGLPGHELEDGSIRCFQGGYDASGSKDGMWVTWLDGKVKDFHHYNNGVRVPPSFHFHPDGSIRAYYPGVDYNGRVQGVGWVWRSDGTPEAAITFKANELFGPAVFFDSDGTVNREKSKVYDGGFDWP